MNSIATSSNHPQPTQWSLVMGVAYCSKGLNPEAISSRLGKGFDPMEAGR